jgi:hypothetical protein
MIFYLVQRQNAKSLQYVDLWGPEPGSRMRFLFYDDLVHTQQARPGTYIFSDLETLSPGQLQLAIEFDEQIPQAGSKFRVLNHPAGVLRRYDALSRLYAEGVNSFRVVRACDSLEGIRFPVFLRRGDDHRGNLTPLLQDQAALDRGLKYVRLQGNRLADILVVEFCDTSDPAGVFRKYSAFVVDKKVLPRHLLFGRNWNLKKPSLKTDELDQEQMTYLQTNPHHEFVADAFRRTNIDYGRIDYAVLGSAPQVWEINTHPTVAKLADRLTEAFEAIDISGDGGPISLSFRKETIEQIEQEMKSRSRNSNLRTTVSKLAGTPVLEPVKQMLKKWLA